MFYKGLFHWSVFGKITILVLTLIPRECHALHEYNLALRKRTYLSSPFGAHHGGFAVDELFHEDYAHSENSTGDPWIVVDLGRPYKIKTIMPFKCSKCDSKFVVGALTNFDDKSNTDWRTYYASCPLNSSDDVLRIFICHPSDEYFRYVIAQSETVNDDVIILELLANGYNYIYYGCYEKMVNDVDTDFQVEDIITCFEICDRTGKLYLYAALKEEKCSCASNMEGLLPLNECGTLCDDGGDHCGGPNGYSVYKEVNPKDFKLDYHCKNNASLNVDWICDKELCEDGWIGHSCLRRDCSVNNGACELHKCNEVEMSSGTTGECICSKGYVKSYWWENCRDVDECYQLKNLCNDSIANCTNTPGGYTCDCFEDGLKYDYNNHTCSVIEEDEHSNIDIKKDEHSNIDIKKDKHSTPVSAAIAIISSSILVTIGIVAAISVRNFFAKKRA